MIRLNCFFKANGSQEFIDALSAAVALTLKSQNHEGCIAYDTFPSSTREDVFMICETWKDQESLDKHSATPEFKENVAIIEKCGLLKLEKFEF